MDLDNKTLTLFKSFIFDICKVFPEHKECIYTNYSDILESNRKINNAEFIMIRNIRTYFKKSFPNDVIENISIYLKK